MHKSGFINIVGRPNVGKSTLMNALVGERMSVITHKPQTTRHRIIGLLSGDDFQIVFSDTPGLVRDPSYKMHEAMNRFVHSTFEDADIMVFVTDVREQYTAESELVQRLNQTKVPVFLVLNKIDLIDDEKLAELKTHWESILKFDEWAPISALKKINTVELLNSLKEKLPEGPAYYPKEQLTDRPERFFVSEIIREKILQQYTQEVPYSCEVVVESFKEGTTRSGDDIIRIAAEIYVSRKTQKSIIIGKNGAAIKKLGSEARKSLETFLNTKVFLELHVRVKDNWRDNEHFLKQFGY